MLPFSEAPRIDAHVKVRGKAALRFDDARPGDGPRPRSRVATMAKAGITAIDHHVTLAMFMVS
jgi:hypothetical protein